MTEMCFRCAAPMVRGIAIDQTFVGGSPDFPGDAYAVTVYAGGPGRLVECMKCPRCGCSVTVKPCIDISPVTP